MKQRHNQLAEMLAQLRRELPLKRPVILRVVPMKDYGSCSLSDSEKHLTICIRSTDSAETQADSLLHEYAHAMDLDINGNHSKQWGKLYSQVYGTWCKHNA